VAASAGGNWRACCPGAGQRAIARSAPSPAPARQPPVRAQAQRAGRRYLPRFFAAPPLRSPVAAPSSGTCPRPTRDGHAELLPAPKRTRRGQRFFDVFRAAALRFGDAVAPLIEVATSSVRRSRASRCRCLRGLPRQRWVHRPRSRIATDPPDRAGIEGSMLGSVVISKRRVLDRHNGRLRALDRVALRGQKASSPRRAPGTTDRWTLRICARPEPRDNGAELRWPWGELAITQRRARASRRRR
jgi:hypothetical protein